EAEFQLLNITVFPNPASDLLVIQLNDLITEEFQVDLYDLSGKRVSQSTIKAGSTIAYFDTQAVYPGTYVLAISSGKFKTTRKVVITK
ncbi:MAG: T9SS type A sorting domain-containing protein, partial [Bacteroidota bacterium]